MISRFWRWPLATPVRFDNGVSEARDLLAAERNYLTGLRSAFTVTVASSAIVFQTNVLSGGAWIDWVLAGVLLAIALFLPVTSVLNYAAQLDAFKREEAEVHNSLWLYMMLLVTGGVTVLVAVREFFRIAPVVTFF